MVTGRPFDVFADVMVRCPAHDLELRCVRIEELASLASLIEVGLFDPGEQTTLGEWYDPADLGRSARRAVAYHVSMWASLDRDEWSLPFGVFEGGRLVGVQGIASERFDATREAHTGSWLARDVRGRGLGTAMRAAILELGFTGLGAEFMGTEAIIGNAASIRVSEKLGYRPNGVGRVSDANGVHTLVRYRIDRNDWASNRRHTVTIEGLGDLLGALGLNSS